MFSYTDDGAKNCVVIKTFEDTAIKEVSAEYNLPDYLPDVSRILRTDARVCRAGKYINGSSLEYDGTVTFSVIYSTADGIIKTAEFSSDYGGSMPIGDFSGDCSVDADTELDSVNVRLQSPRRLTAKAKIAVTVTISCLNCAAPSVTGRTGSGDDIMCKTESIDCCFGIEAQDADVSVSEDISVAAPLPAIDEVVSVYLDPYLSEMKAGEGVINYKGNVVANIIYSAAGDDPSAPKTYVSLIRRIPVSGDAIAEGVTESCLVTGNVCITSTEFRKAADETGEDRTVEIDFSYSAYFDAYKNVRSEITTDMYSTEYEGETEIKALEYRSCACAKSFNFSASACTELPDGELTDVTAIRAAATVTGAEKSGGKLIFTGNVDIYAILSCGGVYMGKIFSSPFRAETDAAMTPDNFDYSADASVIDIKGRTSDGKLCADMEIMINYITFAKKESDVVSVLSLCRDKPRKTDNGAKITLYYPSKGETLWDIAKKYGTTESELAQANGPDGNPEGGVLMIPSRKAKTPIYTKII